MFFHNSIVEPVRRLLRSTTAATKPNDTSSESTSSESEDDMSSVKNLNIHVPPLTGSNYHEWLSAMTSYLRVNDRYIDPAIAFVSLDEAKQQKATAAWDILNLHCDAMNKRLIAPTSNSTDAFRVLKQRYADSSLVNKMGLYYEAFHTPLGSAETISVYVSRKQAAIAQLASMGEKLSDAAQVTTLLHHLPKTYDLIVASVMSWNEDKLNFISVSQLLLNEETRMKHQSAEHEHSHSDTSEYDSASGDHDEEQASYCFPVQLPTNMPSTSKWSATKKKSPKFVFAVPRADVAYSERIHRQQKLPRMKRRSTKNNNLTMGSRPMNEKSAASPNTCLELHE